MQCAYVRQVVPLQRAGEAEEGGGVSMPREQLLLEYATLAPPRLDIDRAADNAHPHTTPRAQRFELRGEISEVVGTALPRPEGSCELGAKGFSVAGGRL